MSVKDSIKMYNLQNSALWINAEQRLGYDPIKKIIAILDSDVFMHSLYVDKNGKELSKDKRNRLGQFYTPGKVCLQMVDRFSFDTIDNKVIIDPTCGSGNLLIACLIAGADTDKLYGNEFDDEVIPTCINRINKAIEILNSCAESKIKDRKKLPAYNIHQGNALVKDCLTLFGPEYDQVILSELLKKRWGMHGGWMNNPQFYKQEVPVIEELQQEENIEIKSTVELGPKINNKIAVENNTEQADLFNL